MAKKKDEAVTELEAQEALEKQRLLMSALAGAYEDQLNTEMGQLHNQFESFISASSIPLPHVLLVLQMLITETIDQAKQKYLGE
jgi:hypothetical protein